MEVSGGYNHNKNGIYSLYVLQMDLIIPVSYQITRQRLSISKKHMIYRICKWPKFKVWTCRQL